MLLIIAASTFTLTAIIAHLALRVWYWRSMFMCELEYSDSLNEILDRFLTD